MFRSSVHSPKERKWVCLSVHQKCIKKTVATSYDVSCLHSDTQLIHRSIQVKKVNLKSGAVEVLDFDTIPLHCNRRKRKKFLTARQVSLHNLLIKMLSAKIQMEEDKDSIFVSMDKLTDNNLP